MDLDLALDLGSTAGLLDGQIRRLAAEHEAERGPSPSPWAWMALGSEGRREPWPPADQDHALALADPDAPGQEAWARGLAVRVEAALAGAGVPPCPGGFTAGRWRLGLAAWCARARAWLEEPTPAAVLEAAVFLDARRAAGPLDLAPLRAVLARAPERPRFLRELARGALAFPVPAPLRALGPGRLEPKRQALAPIVLAARVLGAAAGASATETALRLEAARQAGLLGADTAREAAEAFGFLLELRRRAPGPLPLARLRREERAELRRSLRAARRLQDAVSRRWDLW